jgi:hypothetical protein
MTTENTTTKLSVILDTVGRTILGEVLESTDPSITSIKNPVVLALNQQPDGRVSVGLHPILFRDFLADKSSDVVFNYKTSSITTSNVDAIDFRLQAQYSQIFNPENQVVAPNPSGGDNASVINLFDE